MERARRLHGTDVIEALRIEALVALFSGKFAPAVARLEDVSRLSSQPLEQSADWRHLPCARLLLLGQRCPGQKSPRVTGQPFLRHDVRARRSLARRRARGAGGRSRRTRPAGPRPRPALSRSSRGLWTRCGVCAAGAMPPPPAAGFGLPPTRASLACHGSSAIRCWNRFAAIASTSSSSPTCAAGATPHSPPIIVEGRHRHRRQE